MIFPAFQGVKRLAYHSAIHYKARTEFNAQLEKMSAALHFGFEAALFMKCASKDK